jgi:hypothetical protein
MRASHPSKAQTRSQSIAWTLAPPTPVTDAILDNRVTFYILPTSKSGNVEFLRETTLQKKTFSYYYDIGDFAIDPGQDLLVLLETKYVRY